MKKIKFNEKVTKELTKGAIIRTGFPGFKEDYLGIHSLIKISKIHHFMEIGTSSGEGTKVIANAIGLQKWKFWENYGKKLYSIDVPPGTNPKIIYPGAEDGHPKKAGAACDYPYIQLFGDSTKFDFSLYYPIEGWFIDGKHNYVYAKKDTLQALKSNPSLIIWHDKQIEGVKEAILDVMTKKHNYDLFDLIGTRLIYAVKKQ